MRKLYLAALTLLGLTALLTSRDWRSWSPSPASSEAPPTSSGTSVGAMLPEAVFKNEWGERVELKDLVSRARRTWIAPVFYECPGPCTVVIERVLDAVSGDSTLGADLGKEFQVVFFSFDPKESVELAAGKRAKTLDRRPAFANGAPAAGLHFLSAAGSSADLVCRTLRFSYAWLEDESTFRHDLKIFEVDARGVVVSELPLNAITKERRKG